MSKRVPKAIVDCRTFSHTNVVIRISIENRVYGTFFNTQVQEIICELTDRAGSLTSTSGVDTEPTFRASFNTYSSYTIGVGLLRAVVDTSAGIVVSIIIGVTRALGDACSGGVIRPCHGLGRTFNDASPRRVVSISVRNCGAFVQNASSRLIVSPTVRRALVCADSDVENRKKSRNLWALADTESSGVVCVIVSWTLNPAYSRDIVGKHALVYWTHFDTSESSRVPVSIVLEKAFSHTQVIAIFCIDHRRLAGTLRPACLVSSCSNMAICGGRTNSDTEFTLRICESSFADKLASSSGILHVITTNTFPHTKP